MGIIPEQVKDGIKSNFNASVTESGCKGEITLPSNIRLEVGFKPDQLVNLKKEYPGVTKKIRCGVDKTFKK